MKVSLGTCPSLENDDTGRELGCRTSIAGPPPSIFNETLRICVAAAFVEQFIAHAAVEGFDVAVLHRFAGRNVVQFHWTLFAPVQDRVRGELGTVVGDDHLRLAAPFGEAPSTIVRCGGAQFAFHSVSGRPGLAACHLEMHPRLHGRFRENVQVQLFKTVERNDQ